MLLGIRDRRDAHGQNAQRSKDQTPEYQIDGVNAGQGVGADRLARLLEEMMPPVMNICARQEPSERWISLHMSAQPGQLLLECSSAGRYRLESGRTPEGVSSIKLIQYGDSYRLQVELCTPPRADTA